jgi:RNA polymerase subunit RPABC4/transcription elongation factor Spt4
MDNVDRMFRHLVRTVRSRFPQYLSQPFDVGELHQTILPYRLNRRELALESNDDYEITLTELLSGARGYLIVDDQMRDALRAELESVNPDPTAFKQFASARVAISPAALRNLSIGPAEDTSSTVNSVSTSSGAPPAPRPAAPPQPAAPAAAAPAVAPAAPAQRTTPASAPGAAKTARPNTPPQPTQATQPTPRTSTAGVQPVGMQTITPNAGEHCRSCDELLPAGRPITFCPHCGQNVTTKNCPACGSELELGWKFCPACGRRTAV